MTLSRRSTIKAIGVVGTGSTLAGTALGVAQDDEQATDEAPAGDEELGAIRVGHFLPDAPNVDIYVDDQQILSDVGYAELSPYLEIVPGTYSIAITPAGYDDAIYEGTIAVGSEFYTAAAVGEFEGGSAPGGTGDDSGLGGAGNETAANESAALANESNDLANESNGLQNETAANESATGTGIDAEEGFDANGFDVLLLVDSQTDDAEEGTAPLRLVHAVPDAPTIDIADGETGQTIFEDVGFTEPSGYVPVEPGTQTLEIFPADEDDRAGDTESESDGSDANATETDGGNATDGNETDVGNGIISQPDPVVTVDLELEADTAYTAYAIGYLEEQDDTELTVDESEGATDGESNDGEGDGETNRAFDVYLAVDGEMSDGQETDGSSAENEGGESDDESMDANESTADELESDDGMNRTDERAANESATADH
ncbi:DUF4397 domain-containing protein [Haloterrigena salinisoli]|uniref:DUF4397 domain-containing protein n=1 Tax=Haloterrigena salinisoli TaxID=3132747 RepID=UPI0030CA7258